MLNEYKSKVEISKAEALTACVARIRSRFLSLIALTVVYVKMESMYDLGSNGNEFTLISFSVNNLVAREGG